MLQFGIEVSSPTANCAIPGESFLESDVRQIIECDKMPESQSDVETGGQAKPVRLKQVILLYRRIGSSKSLHEHVQHIASTCATPPTVGRHPV
jgi:hypothetical protein